MISTSKNKLRNKKGQFISNAAYEKRLDFIHNVLRSRSTFFNKIWELRRETYKECGYPGLDELGVADYRRFYDREAIARRVVTVLPEESWMLFPNLLESDKNTNTPFETAWMNLGNNLQGKSWYRSEDNTRVWEYLKRADILSGIGTFGCMLLGFSDGEEELSKPVRNLNSKGRRISTANYDLNYVRVFDESLVQIVGWEKEKRNPRYGLPTRYQITVTDPNTSTDSNVNLLQEVLEVHWTRVIHIADNLGSSEVFGVPRQQAVYNRLYDLIKLYGGSAEMYWRGAFPGFAFETQSELGENEILEIDKDAIRMQMQEYSEGLQRHLLGLGLNIKTLAPQVVDPSPQIDVQLTAICIEKGIPKRIFMGSERGELSSSQDEKAWNKRLSYRQKTNITPRIICPFVDRLILVGALPEPKQGYFVEWPDLNALDEDEKSNILLKRTQSMASFVQSDIADTLMSALDYLVKELDYSLEEAKEILNKFALGTGDSESDFDIKDEMLDEEDKAKTTSKNEEELVGSK